jgi:cytochrome c oxidase assembly protein subunit 15
MALACATFPLLWVGGLVTTTDAGLAVPDWPSTYGYNLFLYPWQTWISGPWDVFVEHGHRLLASAVGLMTIGLVLVLWRKDNRLWMQFLGAAALALVIAQGVLGGVRVLLEEQGLAMLHGITGPLFFGLVVAICVFTSKTWERTGEQAKSAGYIPRLAVVTCILVYLQIVLGAVLRHVPIAAQPTTFALAVKFHLFLAAILSLHVAVLVWLIVRRVGLWPLNGLAWALAGLLTLQLTLGAKTWLVKYSVPYWAAGWFPAIEAPIQDGGALQTHIVTAHMAVGSLLLATSLALALFAERLLVACRPVERGIQPIGATA